MSLRRWNMCVKKHVKFNCHSLQIYMWNLMWSTCENVYERDWIVSHSFHISHVISTHEKACETESELLLQLMWTYMWNLLWSICENVCERDYIVSHPFHIIFTCISLSNFTHIWNMCVKYMWKAVKNMWKVCENDTFFTHCFTGFFTYILLGSESIHFATLFKTRDLLLWPEKIYFRKYLFK